MKPLGESTTVVLLEGRLSSYGAVQCADAVCASNRPYHRDHALRVWVPCDSGHWCNVWAGRKVSRTGAEHLGFLPGVGRGEIKVYTKLLEQVRHQAPERLAEHAKSLGANAVVSVGFDTSEMGSAMTEVLAYGTAVVVEPDASPAQPVALH